MTMAIVENETVHRALADPRRAQIVEELRRAPAGLDAAGLAGRLGLHANTVRFHLGVLGDAGLVESRAPARARRGRPRIVYRIARGASHDSTEEHRLLATILTGAVAEDADGPRRAEAAGRAWGRFLVRRPLPLVRTTDEAAEAEIVALLEQQGFEAEACSGEIHMHRCPFHDLAETHPEVVCAVHRGLIGGALEELGSDLELAELAVFPEPDLCVARLRRPA